MKDSKKREIEVGRKYVICWGSQMVIATACRLDGRVRMVSQKAVEYTAFDLQAATEIHRYHEWVEAQGRANLIASIEDVGEIAAAARRTLAECQTRLEAILWVGNIENSIDEVQAFVYDGRGSAEQLVASIPCTA